MNEPAPIFIHLGGSIDCVNEVLDELLLATKLNAGINSLVDRNKNALTFTVGRMVFDHEHEDIVDIDFNLPD